MFDPSKLHEVTSKLVRAKESFDITVDVEKSIFKLSDEFINRHKLSVNGLKYHLSPDNEIILSVQSEENSGFYRKKTNATKKMTSFKHEVLTNELVSRGVVSGKLKVVVVAEVDGITYLQIVGNSTNNNEEVENPSASMSVADDIEDLDAMENEIEEASATFVSQVGFEDEEEEDETL